MQWCTLKSPACHQVINAKVYKEQVITEAKMKPFSYGWPDSFFFFFLFVCLFVCFSIFFFLFFLERAFKINIIIIIIIIIIPFWFKHFIWDAHAQFSILKSVLPKIGAGKLPSLIAILLLVNFINYDTVTWGLADRLHQF